MMEKIMGDNIYLRKMEIEDTDNIIRWRNNKRVCRNFIYQKPFTRESHMNWIENVIHTGSAIQFIICEKENDRGVGSVYFRDISKEHRKAEYGIFIGEDDAVSKGYGSEAAKLALSYAFETMKLHKVMLRVFADNPAAIRSYEKAGFEREAYLKDEVCIEDKFRDMILMGMINPTEKNLTD